MHQKIKKALVTKYLLSLQPPSIQERLQRDEPSCERIGLQPQPVIGIGERISVPQNRLFGAARGVLEQGDDERLLSLEGEQVVVSKQQGSIYIQMPQTNEEVVLRIPFEELELLSTNQEQRLRALDHCLRKIGPTGPDFTELRQTATDRELSEEEVAALLDAQWNGVVGRQARLQAQLEAATAKVWDLAPDSLDYFDLFGGPDSDNLSPEEYLTSVLTEYRKSLLQRDLQRGVEICLIGALRDDLCPGAWLGEVKDDEVWEALKACTPQIEPFTLLGALDIALYRQHDERFRVFAEEAVSKLTAEEFSDAKGFDLYQVLPSIVKFVLNRINLLDGGALRAPFWKRMCSWMQTAVAIRLLSPLGVDFDRLREQLETRLNRAGLYADLLDLRREPMYRAAELSPSALRWEVVGRLLQLQVRHQAAGRAIPHADDINEAAKRLAEAGPPQCLGFPGPLEGHRRPEEFGRMLPEDARDKLLKLSEDLFLVNIVNFSQIFHWDEETRTAFHARFSKSYSEKEGLNPEDQFTRLTNAGLVAAAERDQELAKVIAVAILSLAPALQTSAAVSSRLQGLLIASAAFEKEDAWAKWLEEQLVEFAGRLPPGRDSTSLYRQLQELKKVTKLDLGIYSRAEALASAAAS